MRFEVSADDWLANADEAPEADVVIAGDVCYEREMSVRALAWLRSHANAGRLVLLGDPGRNYFSAQGLDGAARYEIPTSLQLENRGMRETVVWKVLPASPREAPLEPWASGTAPNCRASSNSTATASSADTVFQNSTGLRSISGGRFWLEKARGWDGAGRTRTRTAPRSACAGSGCAAFRSTSSIQAGIVALIVEHRVVAQLPLLRPAFAPWPPRRRRAAGR